MTREREGGRERDRREVDRHKYKSEGELQTGFMSSERIEKEDGKNVNFMQTMRKAMEGNTFDVTICR